MSDGPRTTTRTPTARRCARFVAALVCLLAVGLVAPPHSDDLAIPVALAGLLPSGDESGYETESASVSPARPTRHAPPVAAPTSATPHPVARGRASVPPRPPTADRCPASTPLRC